MNANQIMTAIVSLVNAMMKEPLRNRAATEPARARRCNELSESYRALTGSYPSIWSPVPKCNCIECGKPLSLTCPHDGHKRRAAAALRRAANG